MKRLVSFLLSYKKVFLPIVILIVFFFVQQIQAGTFTSAKLTISDSRASNTSTQYDFAYTTSVTTAIKQVTIVFCTTASGTCRYVLQSIYPVCPNYFGLALLRQ
jgi:hypothetical protein